MIGFFLIKLKNSVILFSKKYFYYRSINVQNCKYIFSAAYIGKKQIKTLFSVLGAKKQDKVFFDPLVKKV